MDPGQLASLVKSLDPDQLASEEVQIEHIQWRAIANPHTLEI